MSYVIYPPRSQALVLPTGADSRINRFRGGRFVPKLQKDGMVGQFYVFLIGV